MSYLLFKLLEEFSHYWTLFFGQPDHLRDDAMFASKRLGEDRAARGSFLMKTLLRNGTVLALGSDWMVSLTNLYGVHADLVWQWESRTCHLFGHI